MTTASAVDAGHKVSTTTNSQHVVVRAVADGSVIADSSSGHVLRETGMPDRWYLPRADVKMALAATDTTSHCPFKGDASYWTVTLPSGPVLTDVAWSYEDPRSDVIDIAGEVSFWTDAITVDVAS